MSSDIDDLLRATSISLTREELYEKVWSEPMSVLSSKFGLSDVGLAKVCRRLRVPRPYRGYWARKAAGQKVHRTPLPKLSPSALESIKAVTIKSRPAPDGTPAESATGPVAKQQRFERQDENKIEVAAHLEDPHPLVAQTVVALRRAKPDQHGYLTAKQPCLSARVTLDSSDRAMCILDALIKALDARGYSTTVRKNGEVNVTEVHIGNEAVGISLIEQVNRVERKDAKRKYSWMVEYDWIATGRLTLRIDDGWVHGARQSWSDGKQQKVENCLNGFIVGLVFVAEGMRQRTIEREEREREWREAEERRALELRRREEEEARVRALLHTLDRRHTAREVREYVDAVRTAMGANAEMPEDLSSWLQWAEGYADRIDPLLPTPSVPEDPNPKPTSQFGWQR
jgi:hypothetical protein